MSDLTNIRVLNSLFTQGTKPLDAPALVSELGGSYAAELGIHLGGLETTEVYKWFLAAMLYGARISENIANRTWQVFRGNDVLTPECMINIDWDRLVALLDQGGYVRYDYKTATKLQTVSHALLDHYAGDLNRLHAVALDSSDLERRIMSLGKGVGKVTTQIFLRELRGRWSKAAPPLSLLAFNAAQALGFLPEGINDNNKQSLSSLQQLWCKQGMTTDSFPDFEAALVRYGLHLRHCKI